MLSTLKNPRSLLDGPASPAPRYEGDWLAEEQHNARLLCAILAVCMALVSLFIAIRLYTQLSIHRKLEIEDCKPE